MIRAAYEERFLLSRKQVAALDKWDKKKDAKLVNNDASDVTIEEETSDYYYGSD